MFHVKQSPLHILLINPWITDFAAYNLWARPLGLLRIGSFLRRRGIRISLIDCLDFYSTKRKYGVGKFFKTKIPKPYPLRTIPRNYGRYGITEEMLGERLSAIERPDLIGIASGMTYWYPGLLETIKVLRSFYKDTPIVLGGIYATLCYDHAVQFSGADFVIQGNGEIEFLKIVSKFSELSDLSGINAQTLGSELQTMYPPYPCYDLYPQLDSVSMLTSKGCPFRCSYCASRLIDGGFFRRDPQDVIKEIEYWTNRYAVKNIAFYDDALLVEPYAHLVPILKGLSSKGIHCNFHAPNGLHIRVIDQEIADLLFRSQFKTIRLGFETSNEKEQTGTGGKVTNQEFQSAVRNLRKAGYSPGDIGVYLLVGMPGQKATEVEESIAYTRETGARPILVEYSPVPGTPLFEKATSLSQFDIRNEPLFHNNSILPCQWERLTLADYRRLKEETSKGI